MVAVTSLTSDNLPQPAFLKGDSVKVLSRLASPAGFGLVLLLFLVLPFMSVSCEVPGASEPLGLDYSGANLTFGTDPEVQIPQELAELSEESDSPGSVTEEPPPDPGVQLLAIFTALFLLFGIGTVLIPRLKARLFGAAGIAGIALVLTVVTLVVAQSTLESSLLDEARETGAAETADGMPDIESVISDMIGSELGFWLVVVGLGLLALGNVGAALLGGRIRVPAFAGAPGAPAVSGEPPTEPGGAPPTVDPLTGQVLPEQSAEAPATPPADPPQSDPPQSGPAQS